MTLGVWKTLEQDEQGTITGQGYVETLARSAAVWKPRQRKKKHLE